MTAIFAEKLVKEDNLPFFTSFLSFGAIVVGFYRWRESAILDMGVNFRYSLNVNSDVWAPLAHYFSRSFAALIGFNGATSGLWSSSPELSEKCYDGEQEAKKTCAIIAHQTSLHNQDRLSLIARNSLLDPQTSYSSEADTHGDIQWRQNLGGEVASGT